MSKKKKKDKPTTILLIRHGENDWTATGRLAGRTPGVHLNSHGQKQAAALGKRLAKTKLKAIYASPLERTMETAQAIAAHHKKLTVVSATELLEVDFGDWKGKSLEALRKTPEWPTVQHAPSRVQFPQGETMYQMQTRWVAEVIRLAGQHPGKTIALVGHSDPIKATVAHFLGLHLDLFQRIAISTASISVIQLTDNAAFVVSVNDTSHNPPQPKEKPKKKKQKHKKSE